MTKNITLWLSVSLGFPTLILIQQLANKLKNVNKNRHGQVQKKSVFTSEFSTFPFPTWCGTHWFLRVPPGGARAKQKSTAQITSTKNQKGTAERARTERQLGH